MSGFYLEIVRDEITLIGVDARKFLHSQLANDITSLLVGQSRYSLLLEPTGKITSLVRVRCIDEDTFVLDTDAGFGEITSTRLSRFKIRIKCEIAVSSRTYFAFRELTLEHHAKLISEVGVMNAWRGARLELDVASMGTPEVAREKYFEIRQGTFGEYEHARVLAAWPQMSVDMTSDSIPSETGLTDIAVSFTKGCYPGQELVERMDSRGTAAPRSLRVIRATPGATTGSTVELDGKDIGIYTTVVNEIALALIKRNAESGSIQIGS